MKTFVFALLAAASLSLSGCACTHTATACLTDDINNAANSVSAVVENPGPVLESVNQDVNGAANHLNKAADNVQKGLNL